MPKRVTVGSPQAAMMRNRLERIANLTLHEGSTRPVPSWGLKLTGRSPPAILTDIPDILVAGLLK